jgi:hypothetical protein
MTIYLKFPDKATAQSVLSAYYSSEYGWDRASLTHSLDPVGVIYKDDGVYDEIGNVITEPTMLDGWHVNFIGDLPSCASAYELNPAKPKRIFAE